MKAHFSIVGDTNLNNGVLQGGTKFSSILIFIMSGIMIGIFHNAWKLSDMEDDDGIVTGQRLYSERIHLGSQG